MKSELQQAFDQGGESFRKYCLRYGTIVSDIKHIERSTGKDVREYVIRIFGSIAWIKMVGGDVTNISLTGK